MRKVLQALRSALLLPFSWLWEWVYKLRRSAYEFGFCKRHYFKVPVVSVGNLSFGGTGKTPMILWLAEKMSDMGLSPVVLTRGYKGQLEESSGVLKSGQRFRLNPHDYGDEPLMIASKMKKGAVIVGKERAKNLLRYFSEVRPDVVLLDDGFQHLSIYRSLNLVLFDATMELSLYRTAPLGYLREGLGALKHADVIILSRANMVSPERLQKLRQLLERHVHHQPVWCQVGYRPIGLFDVNDNFQFRIEELEGRDVIAVTAIASPESFFKTLGQHGAKVLERVTFPDHHFFSPEEVHGLLLKASRLSALIVCSEKDMVKLRRVSQDSRIFCVKVQLEFLSGEDSLIHRLGTVLRLVDDR